MIQLKVLTFDPMEKLLFLTWYVKSDVHAIFVTYKINHIIIIIIINK